MFVPKPAGQRYDLAELQATFATALPFTPHSWQLEDIKSLLGYDRAGIFLPVGAGKTFVATFVALGWNDHTRIVLLPPILIKQWVLWLNSVPNSGGAIAFKGSPNIRRCLPIQKYRWLVMSVAVFRNDFTLLSMHFADCEVTVIVDEAQCLKSAASRTFKSVQSFAAGRKLLLLTGTELNSPMDAYAYIKLKTHEAYRSATHFQNLHVVERDSFDQPTAWRDLDVVATNLYANSVKRNKENVHAHLPRANYIPIEYDLDPSHVKLYKKLAEEMLLELPSGGKIDVTQVSALHNALQQIVINWSHFAGVDGLRPSAFDVLDQCFDEIGIDQPGASKFIVWTWFKKTTESVLAYCNSRYPGAAVAAYSGTDSQASVARFLDDSDCMILVGQPGSVGMGLNPQHLCWESLFLEAPTVSIPFRQAAGRIDREGQRYNPNIRVAMASGTIQTRMFRRLLSNDADVMRIQDEMDLRTAIFGG